MINLLPYDIKSSYSYAHKNVFVLRWILLCCAALIGLGSIGTFGVIYLSQIGTNLSQQVAINQSSLSQQKLSSTVAQVQTISDNLKLTVKVLSQEVLFSKLLDQMATAMPNGAILTGLNITQASGAIDITARATNYTTATQIQVNLASPANKIFSSADIVSIQCGTSSGGASSGDSSPTTSNTATNSQLAQEYPCSVNLTALFAKDNPFLFVNQTGGGAKS